MGYGRLPVDEQLAGFRALLTRNPTLVEVLTRAAVLALPDWYLVAGCLYQTVWNVVTGQPPESGILDYDLAYFDSSDLSWHAEDAVIQEGGRLFGDLPARSRSAIRLACTGGTSRNSASPARRTTPPRRRSTRSRQPPPALACALSPARTGASTPARAWGRVQPRCPPQPEAGTPPRLPGQDHPVAAAMAISDRPALARARRRPRDLLKVPRQARQVHALGRKPHLPHPVSRTWTPGRASRRTAA